MKTSPSARCRAMLERLSLYVDGELSGIDRRTIARHLRACPCCEQFVESLRRTAELCHEAGHRRLPPRVRARARARIAELLGVGQGFSPARHRPRSGQT
jgi:anti-sigma factor RsiW